MRKLLSFFAITLLSVSSLTFAQETSTEDSSVEAKIAQVVSQSEDTARAIAALLDENSTELTDAQKIALAALPADAQAFFIETVVSGEEATDAALTTATTQAGVTTEMGTILFEAFSPMLADINDETNQGNLFQTAAGPTATGPIGFGTGAGGGGGGGAAASNN